MSSVDNRAVHMTFDNAAFEKNLAETMKSMNALKKSLDFTNAKKSFADLDSASRGLNLGHLASSVEGVSAKFLAFGTIAVTTLANITNRAVDAGINLVKSLSIDPILGGYRELETNINSIQTILANTSSEGVGLQDVNAALDQLNTYADQTIYNFSQMARNIGTFTAAGVDLDTSVNAIKGIANLAAISGSSAEQAATGMYQLSQAIAAGSVRLMDWNSVVNAGFGGEVFQKALFETGKALGTLKGVDIGTTFEEWTSAGNTFRQSLAGTGEMIDETTRAAQANKEAADAVADAEENAADAVANAQRRIIDAQKAQSDAFEQGADDIARATEAQNDAVVKGAEDVERALQNVVDARERLSEALKPASEDDLQAATDRLTTAQLDQADTSTAITDAERDQLRARQDLAAAQKRYNELLGSGSANTEQRLQAQRAVQDAEARVLDLADAVERARLRQNAAVRDVHAAEEELNATREKGTEADQNVVDALAALSSAERAVVEAQQEAVKRQQEANQNLADVVERSKERQVAAAENLAEAEKNSADVAVDAQETIARAHQRAAQIIEQSAALGGPPTWLTDEVLTTTLSAFTGDLDAAQLKSLGYTEEQAKELEKLGKLGQDAATDVKTLTQLLSTVKEAIGSGWASSFRLIFGDFEQSKETFSSFSDTIGEMVKNSTDKRNKLLQGWADLGGRTKLIQGISDAFGSLKRVLDTISEAFFNIFPPVTSERLFTLTERFADFFQRLRNNDTLFDTLRTTFEAFFAVVRIGIRVVTGIAGVIQDLFNHFNGGGALVDFFNNFSDAIMSVYDALITGGGLDRFFAAVTEKLIAFGEALKNPGQLLDTIRDSIVNFFKGIDFGSLDGIIEALDRVKDYILDIFDLDKYNFNLKVPDSVTNFFKTLFGNVGENTSNSIELGSGFDALSDALSTLWDVTKKIGDGIKGFFDILGDIASWVAGAGANVIDFFENLGPNIQKAIMSDEFDKILEFMQTLGVLLGGAGIAKIGKDGLSVKADLTGGLLSELSNAFKKGGLIDIAKQNLQGLTGVLDAMQTQIKAGALLKIAEAVALLTASVTVLSFINPDALAKALTAMSVGFGQLLGAFAILNTIASGPKGAVNFAAVSAGLIALSTAILILSGAMAVMATLSWEEIGKGLTGLAGALLILVAATKLISGGGGISLIATGIGLSAVAGAMILLAGAVKVFSMMSWEEIGKGLAAIGAGLLIIAGTLQLMPAATILIGPGLVAVAFALTELGAAMLIFATMSWEEIGKGLTVLAGGLLIIAGAMNLMPVSTILSGPGLVAIATGLVILGAALKSFGSMKWEEIGKAMTVLASSLLILAGAMALMQGGIPGAIAVGIMAGSLLILNKALKEFAKLSWKELGKGLAGIAAALLTLGLAAAVLSPVVGTIFALGLALLALGAGFALIGVGAALLAEAFQVIAAAGTAGIDVLMYAIDQLLIRLPEMARQLAVSILDMADIILTAAPGLIDKLGQVIGSLLGVIADNADEFGIAATAWILAMLKTIRDSAPDFITTAFLLVQEFLKGVKDNAKEYGAAGLGIITEFIKGLTQGLPDFVETVVEFIATFLTELAKHEDEYITAGLGLLLAVLKGITENLDEIEDAVAEFIGRLIQEIANLAGDIVDAGIDALISFLEGLAEDIPEIAKNVGLMVTNIIDALADEFVAAVDRTARIIIDFLNDLAEVIRKNDDEMSDAMANLGAAIIEGIIVGLVAAAPKLMKKVASLMQDAVEAAGKPWEWFSPSHVMMRMGNDIIEGLIIGLDDNSGNLNKKITRINQDAMQTFTKALNDTATNIEMSSEFNPTITPVLDLSKVQEGAAGINGLLGTSPFTPDVSFQQANQLLAETSRDNEPDTDKEENVRSITFIQTNNSPESLNTARIYKNTNGQIERAKRELEKL